MTERNEIEQIRHSAKYGTVKDRAHLGRHVEGLCEKVLALMDRVAELERERNDANRRAAAMKQYAVTLAAKCDRRGELLEAVDYWYCESCEDYQPPAAAKYDGLDEFGDPCGMCESCLNRALGPSNPTNP